MLEVTSYRRLSQRSEGEVLSNIYIYNIMKISLHKRAFNHRSLQKLSSIICNILVVVRQNLFIFVLLILGTVSQLLMTLPFGRYRCIQSICGLFYPSNIFARDEMWHLALSGVAFDHIPFVMPILFGAPLTGYHILYDLLISIFRWIDPSSLHISNIIFPIFWLSLYIFFTLKISEVLNLNKYKSFFFVFMQFFAGSFGYLLTLYHKGTIFGSEGMNYNPILYLTNKPLALSLILFLWIYTLVLNKKPHNSIRNTILLLILLFFQWGAKFHGGTASLFLICAHYYFLYLKRQVRLVNFIVTISIFAAVSAIAIYLFYSPNLFAHGNVSPLSWAPLSLSRSIIEDPNLFYLPQMTNARYYLYQQNLFSPRLIFIEIFSLCLYLVFVLGTRVIGLVTITLQILKEVSHQKFVEVFVIVSTLLMMILFVQHGDWFNTMQFFTYALVLLNISTAIGIGSIIERLGRAGKYLTSIICVLFASLTIPYALSVILPIFCLPFRSVCPTYVPSSPLVYISDQELKALEYLGQTNAKVVYSYPGLMNYKSVNPIWNADDTAYVSALSHKQSFAIFLHQSNMMMGEDYLGNYAYHLKNISLKSIPDVDYYYLVKKHNLFLRDKNNNLKGLSVVYENSEVIILKK